MVIINPPTPNKLNSEYHRIWFKVTNGTGLKTKSVNSTICTTD